MPYSKHPCPRAGCPETTTTGGACDTHRSEAERARGSAAARGYDHQHREQFRNAVLRKDPLCVCDSEHRRGHGTRTCGEPSLHADHHPRSRRQIEQAGLDPNDPQHGRGICGRCHSWHTSQAQPGGWHAR